MKPLHYAFHQGSLVFASEAKGLHALDGSRSRSTPAYWTGPGVAVAECAMTPFRGISSVRPGHVVRVSRDRVREERYFQPTFGPRAGAEAGGSIDDAAAAVRATLTRAVRRRLDGDPPIALSLSSGVDSTIVCGLMAEEMRRRGRTFTAFSIGYDGASYDESAVARRSAAHFGVPFERVGCTAEGLADGFLAGIHATEVTTNSLSTTARLALTRAVRGAGYKALMSGEGSDELFGGYPYFGVEAIWRLLAGDAEARARGERAFAEFRRTEARSRGVFWEDGDDWKTTPPLFGAPSAYHPPDPPGHAPHAVDVLPRVAARHGGRDAAPHLGARARPVPPPRALAVRRHPGRLPEHPRLAGDPLPGRPAWRWRTPSKAASRTSTGT